MNRTLSARRDQLASGERRSDQLEVKAWCADGEAVGVGGVVGAGRAVDPEDRSRNGSKHHLITCGRGTPLSISLTAGNRNDITQLLPLVDAIPPVRGQPGRPRRRPRKLLGDRAYHSRAARRDLRKRGIAAKIASPKSPHGT